MIRSDRFVEIVSVRSSVQYGALQGFPTTLSPIIMVQWKINLNERKLILEGPICLTSMIMRGRVLFRICLRSFTTFRLIYIDHYPTQHILWLMMLFHQRIFCSFSEPGGCPSKSPIRKPISIRLVPPSRGVTLSECHPKTLQMSGPEGFMKNILWAWKNAYLKVWNKLTTSWK